MITEIPEDLIHIVILEIASIYVQIHNDGYFSSIAVKEIKEQYSDKSKWRIVEV